MPVTEQQFSEMHERQSKLESTVAQVAGQLQQLATNQQTQATEIRQLTTATAGIQESLRNLVASTNDANASREKQWDKLEKIGRMADAARVKEGRVSPIHMLAWLVPVCGFIAAIAAMYIAPLQQRLETAVSAMSTHIGSPGHTDTLVYRAGNDTRMLRLESLVAEDHKELTDRLKEEAAAWRECQRKGK